MIGTGRRVAACTRLWLKRRLASLLAAGRSPVDVSRGVAILCYHSTVSDRFHPWWIDFRGQMIMIEDLGYEVVTLSSAVERLRAGLEITRPTLAITFDDGWADNLTGAFPELARRGWPSTVFVCTSFLGRRPYLLARELSELPEYGVEVENHTHTHRDLTRLDAAAILDEIRECSLRLEDLTGRRPRFFCYPYGRYTPAVRAVVASSGMEAACSSRVGFNARGQDLFLLRRLTMEGGDRAEELRVRLAGGYDFLDRKQRIMDRG